jgi:hypothetical protein
MLVKKIAVCVQRYHLIAVSTAVHYVVSAPVPLSIAEAGCKGRYCCRPCLLQL